MIYINIYKYIYIALKSKRLAFLAASPNVFANMRLIEPQKNMF